MLGTNYETAWFLFHRLREAAVDVDPTPLGGEDRFVEADETYVGGKARNNAAAPDFWTAGSLGEPVQGGEAAGIEETAQRGI